MSWQSLFDALAEFGARVLRFADNYAHELPSRLWDLAILTVLVFIVFGIEAVIEGRDKSSLKRWRANRASGRTDLISTLLTTLELLPLLGIAMTGGVIYFLLKFTRQQFGIPAPLNTGHPVLSVLLFLLLVDFFSYWGHRLFHRIGPLWVLHRYHHSSPEMNVLNTFRTHPIYVAVSSLWMAIPMFVVSPPAEQIVGVAVLMRLHTLLQHSNLQSDWGWIGRWVLQSPAMHRIHHSTAVKHHDKNFGATFVFWDILFGTLCIEPRQRRDAIVIGVDDDPGTKRPWRYIVDVYVEFLRKAVAAAAGLVRPIGRFGR